MQSSGFERADTFAREVFVTHLRPGASSFHVKRRIVAWGIVAAVALLSYGGYIVWRAQRNLVTLDVRNMDVRKVVSKIEWQTWERILVHNDVQGKVTFKVERVPIEEVLNIISDQISTRWTRYYPLYSKSDSLVTFKKAVRGDVEPETAGWTNLQTRGGFRGGPGGPGPGGMFGDVVRSQNNLVNLELINRDLDFATLALARFSQARIVPENGTSGHITTHLQQVPYQKAVAAVAKQVNRKWDQFYALQPGFGFGRDGGPGGRDRDVARGEGRGEFGRGERRRDGTNRVDDPQFAEDRQERRDAERQRMQEAQLATMTAEEQKKAEEDRQRFEAMRNMSPEERQKAFQEMASRPEFQQRMQQRQMNQLKNTTPQQRAERDKRRTEWQQRRQQGSGQGR
jgi:hypothetical protein